MGCVGSKVPAGTELEPANPPSGSNSKSARGRTKVPFSPSRNGVSTRQRSSNDNSKHDNRSPKAAISPARRRKAEKERLLEERRRKNEVMNLKIALGLWLDVHMPAAAVRLRMFMFGQGLRNEAKENADEVTGDDSVAPVNYGGPLNGTDSAEVVAKPKPRQPTANGFVRISVEAAGSGIPLIASMLLPFDSTVPELKRAISERLSDRPSFSLLLFAGHGGPVLDSHPFRPMHEEGIVDGTVVVVGSTAVSRVDPEPRPKCIGKFDASVMNELHWQLETHDPRPFMERHNLRPHHIPFWIRTSAYPATIWTTARLYLDGKVSSRSDMETILNYAHRLQLPSKQVLQEWFDE
eukprot:INCI10002.1.p1 GENE.INCI10002.1~~INCI10002.1.p1  ORF type:complete len:351 (+),score=46.88 INCI10002.1:398-1450(+)